MLLPADGSLTAAELDRRLAGIVERHVPTDQRFSVTFSARPARGKSFLPRLDGRQLAGHGGGVSGSAGASDQDRPRREAVRALGWRDPTEAVGEILYAFGQQPHEVIGVVDDVPSRVRASESDGVAFVLNQDLAMTHIVRVSGTDVDRAVERVESVWAALLPDRPPPRQFFLDQVFDNAHWAFEMINRVIGALALSALAMAGIGLFGMASYMTGRRTREIGLRKSQGASCEQILRLLLLEFAKPVVAANVIAWPVAFVAADRYIDLFAERIALTPAPFLAALLATLGIAGPAVGARATRAARMRPTDALRHE